MSYQKKGYKIINIGKKKKIINFRKKIIKIFSLASKSNNYKEVKSDKDIIDLYIKKKNSGLLDIIKLKCYQISMK